MTPNPFQTLEEALRAEGFRNPHNGYVPLTDSIILIGSRASGCARPDSDWDIIQLDTAVETIEHALKSEVQLIRINPDFFHKTELGIHACSHGVGISAPVPRKDELDIPLATASLRRRIRQRVERMWTSKIAPRTVIPTSLSNRVLMDCLRLRHALQGRIPPNRFIQDEAKVTSAAEEVLLLVEFGGISVPDARKLMGMKQRPKA